MARIGELVRRIPAVSLGPPTGRVKAAVRWKHGIRASGGRESDVAHTDGACSLRKAHRLDHGGGLEWQRRGGAGRRAPAPLRAGSTPPGGSLTIVAAHRARPAPHRVPVPARAGHRLRGRSNHRRRRRGWREPRHDAASNCQGALAGSAPAREDASSGGLLRRTGSCADAVCVGAEASQRVGHVALADDIASVAYWYQREPHAGFPELLSLSERWPR